MQKISNLEEVVPKLKLFLRKYLESKDTDFHQTLFTCPNRKEHSNEDAVPSCGFVPETDETIFHCFSCSESNNGDIFTAYYLLEDKPIKGIHFHQAVKDLCDQFSIPYRLKPISEQEEKFENVQNCLSTLVKFANNYLKDKKPEMVIDYIKGRGWESVIDKFEFGFLPDNSEIRERINKLYIKVPYLGEYISISPSQIVDRLIYPLKDSTGNIIGLMDRALEKEEYRPKYQKYFLKTLERGEVLFNLSSVYPEVYLVEGASSIFTMVGSGIKNVIAVLGKEFTDNMYKSLVKHEVKKVILCFDGDEPGLNGLKKAVKFFESHPDIKSSVKIIPNLLDPDDYIKQYSSEEFKKIEEKPIFKYQLDNFKDCTDELIQEEYRISLLEILSNIPNHTTASKLINQMSEELTLPKKSIVDDLKLYEGTKRSLNGDISISDIITEETSLLEQVEIFEERSLRYGKLLGTSTGFPILDQKLDGLQIGMALLCGKWNAGKTSFMESIMINLLRDPNCVVGFFSLDDSVIAKTIPRLIANLSKLPINSVSNPIHAIENNQSITKQERELQKKYRNEAIETLKKYAGRLCIKDAVDGNDVKHIEKTIKTLKRVAGDRHLIVFVDFINMVNPLVKAERTEQESTLARFFKDMTNKYHCTIVATVEASKEILTAKISENSIKGSSSFPSMADVVMLLYSSFDSTDSSAGSEMYYHDPVRIDHRGQPLLHPIVRVYISKNKWNGHRESIYYRFEHDTTVYQEGDLQEQIEYSKKK